MYIPEGYGTVFPYIVVQGTDKLTDFLVEVFGAKVQGKTVHPSGQNANIRIRIGTSVFMISEAREGESKEMPSSYYIYVNDVDSTFDSALKNGAKKIFEPGDMPYQDRQAGIIDPSGNKWFISRRLVEEPYDVWK